MCLPYNTFHLFFPLTHTHSLNTLFIYFFIFEEQKQKFYSFIIIFITSYCTIWSLGSNQHCDSLWNKLILHSYHKMAQKAILSCSVPSFMLCTENVMFPLNIATETKIITIWRDKDILLPYTETAAQISQKIHIVFQREHVMWMSGLIGPRLTWNWVESVIFNW